ncbi:MAG TPA: hypothetical protein VNX47_05825 [Nevskia sp.]|jgi:hypothetical protein|nr:hypothetical protein [Nevskia sp.]
MSTPSPSAADYLRAMRCPVWVQPQTFGLWTIQRRRYDHEAFRLLVGHPYQTALCRLTDATMLSGGATVMEDSTQELSRHLPILLAARGRVLVSGLGLGCVLRGLLANPAVRHVDVVEVDQEIIDAIWPEFAPDPRCMIHHGDALTCAWPPGTRWDFAWHDVWCEGDGQLHLLHLKLITRYRAMAEQQGAWQLPRLVKRVSSLPLVGASRSRSRRAA